MIRGLEHLPYTGRLRKSEKVVWRPQSSFQYLQELRGRWRGPIHQDCSDRTGEMGTN